MGFSLAASYTIIGISLLITLEIFSINVLPIITDVHESYQNMMQRSYQYIQTDIDIQNVTTIDNGSNYDLTIALENTGETTITLKYCQLLINGSPIDFSYTTEYLFSDELMMLYVDNVSYTGSVRMKFISENRVSDMYTFEI